MALISSSYTPPGIEVTETFAPSTATLNPSASLPVIIGEGLEFFTDSNVQLFRGSSAIADQQAIEDISDQITGTTRTFQLTHFPVVTGNGTGTTSTNPANITVTANGVPVTVLSLNGALGQFSTQTIVPLGQDLVVTYFFKNKDTQVLNENDSFQVPTFASLTVGALKLSLSTPGELGNLVSLTLVLGGSGTGVSDALAVTGQGTDAISINILNADGTTRTDTDLAALITAGIQTADGGLITFTGTPADVALTALAQTLFTGGSGPSTNTSFFLQNVPVVDGTNGGVVTTDPTKVSALVNGIASTVSAIDGSTGFVTLANAVPPGATLEFTYFTNTFQNTADLLPSQNVASIVEVGFGPNRDDFTEGVDYVLNGNTISWGATANTTVGTSTPGFTVFDATQITTTLVDQKVFLRPVTGTVSGRNSTFTLQDVPVNGSGLGVPTNNVSLISVYVGATPVAALTAGPVKVSSLNGSTGQFVLFNPPAQGKNVYASYFRSVLNDHEFSLAVQTAGVPEVGTYVITDELNQIAPLATNGANHVTDQNFTNTGIVFPFNASDEIAALGGADETVTFTFQNDGLSTTTSPATQASLTVAGTVTFQATTPGTAGNNVTIALISGGSGVADSGAVTQSGTNGENISIELLEADGTTVRTWADVINLFSGTNGVSPITVSGAGQITCTAVTSPVNSLTSQASAQAQTALSGGLAAVTQPFANRYLVTTSRTAAQAAADGLGLTGGATTPSSEDQNFVQVGVTTGFTAGGVLPVGTSGFLGQTYIDPVTAFQVTVVDPANALSFGFTQLPSPQYTFAPGDTLTWVVSRENGQITGSKPTIAIPGLQTTVVTTLGCNPGDTAVISTFNRAGTSPAVGEAYFVTFTVAKTAADMAIQTFTNTAAAFAVYGQPDTTANRLSLAINLLNLNGGQQFAAIQVPMQTGLGVASDQSFIDAIQSLATPMSGSGQQPNVIVPLSTSANVQQALSLFLIKQSALGQSGMFAIGFGGFDQFTSTTTMQATAQSIANQRVILNSANSVGIELTAQGSTTAVEFAVTGEFVAAAMAGTYLSPQNDVATDITGQDIIGFTRSLIMFDGPTKNSLAASGITVLNDRNGALEVRDYRTTNPSNILTSKPYVTTTADYISRAITLNLKQFKGRKMTSDLPSSILGVINSMLTSWNSNNSSAIISAYQNVTVVPDSVDPTTIDIALQIRPIFSALFFKVALTVSLSS